MGARVPVLHVHVDPVDMNESVKRVRGFLESPRAHQIVTANPLMILASEKDPDLEKAFRHADLVLPDSWGVRWAARRAGYGYLDPVPGIELMERLCREASQRGWRVGFLGARPGVAEAAAAKLREKYPSLRVAGVEDGYFPPDQEDSVCRRIADSKPDLLFVAMSLRRQDGWIQRNLSRLGAKAVMGVGGSFDVLSGRLKRAPAWMRRAGLEWSFRLVQEPRRLRRMLGLPLFAWKVLRS